jgi:hypothetical protein
MFSTSVLSYSVLEDIRISEIKLPANQLRSQQDLEELTISIIQRGSYNLSQSAQSKTKESMKSSLAVDDVLLAKI